MKQNAHQFKVRKIILFKLLEENGIKNKIRQFQLKVMKMKIMFKNQKKIYSNLTKKSKIWN